MKGDFIGFSFDGIHCSELGITHVSSSDRYDEELFPEIRDKTIEVPNNHGEYYYGSTYGTRTFEIEFAYDTMTETQFRRMRRLFSTSKICELIFDERPYKVYYAKIESPLEMSYVCFDEEEYVWETSGHEGYISGSIDHKVYTGKKRRIYKGDGTISLICYQPFAHQLFKVKELYERAGENQGNLITVYDNIDEWIDSSGILTEEERNINHIDKVVKIPQMHRIITVPPGGTEYQLQPAPIGNVEIIGIDSEHYTVDNNIYTFENNTDTEIKVHIFYSYEESDGIYTYSISVYNPGDLNTGFYLYIPFNNNEILPKSGNSDIIIKGDENYLVLKPITKKGNDTGILINTVNHLIEGVVFSQVAHLHDYRNPSWQTTGNLYNEYIKAGDFPYIKRNDWLLDDIANQSQIIYISCTPVDGISIYYDYLYF